MTRSQESRFRWDGNKLAGGIYGTVTAMAVIAALSDGETTVRFMAAAAVLTSLTLAFTFVFSHWIADSHGTETHTGAKLFWREELPTLVGPVVIAAVMVALKLMGVGTVAAAEGSLWFGTGLLFVLGFRVAEESGRALLPALGLGVLDAAIGAAIVALKVLAH